MITIWGTTLHFNVHLFYLYSVFITLLTGVHYSIKKSQKTFCLATPHWLKLKHIND